MKRINVFLMSLLITMAVLSSCKDDDDDVSPSEPEVIPLDNDNSSNSNENSNTNTTGIDPLVFAYGCDPSWVTPMEADNIVFRNSNGVETECLSLLKSVGFNAARFRVWVNPAQSGGNGMCDIDDVLQKCLRAKAQGMAIMIDFHYSDSWADPAKQKKPKAWDNIATLDELAQKVYDYTKESLTKLKDNDIDVSWVQIGNETRTGMIKTQSDGSATSVNGEISDNNSNFATLCNKAYAAIKEVYPNSKAIVHIDKGTDYSRLTWFASVLKKTGANYDILGVSFYPSWDYNDWYDDKYVSTLVSNLNYVAKTYDKDVMVCEIGAPTIASWYGKRMIVNTVIRAREEVERCKGVFYWEPECYSSYNSYSMGGFLADGSPSEALNVFAGNMTSADLLPETNPNDEYADKDVLVVTTIDGSQLGVLEKQDDDTYKGTVTFPAGSWTDFKVYDQNNTYYGTKDWDSQYSVVTANGEYNHFWSDEGTYTIIFDITNGKWSQTKL